MATLQTLRRSVGVRLGDCIPFTITDGDSSKMRFKCQQFINRSSETVLGREVIFLTAGNAGEVRSIVEVNNHEGWAGLDRAVPEEFVGGVSQGEMYNRRGRGIRVFEYLSVFNDAIRESHPDYKVGPIIVDAGDEFDMADPYWTIPTEFNHLWAVEAMGRDGRWNTVPIADERNGQGWSVIGAEITIRNPRTLYMYQGLPMRFVGSHRAVEFTDDSDTTDLLLPERWLKNTVEHRLRLLLTAREPSNPNHYNEGLVAREDAEKTKIGIRTRGLAVSAKWVRD